MNMNFSASKKNETVMIYPANSYTGYMMCKEFMHGNSHVHGQKKMEAKEVLAICCGQGGMYEKLKDMGKPIKVIVLDDASNHSNWKKEMKGRKCDCMMLCTEGAPHHHNKAGMAREEGGKEHIKKFAESLEIAVEMCRDMNCKSLLMTTAFAADDSKYKHWHQLFKSVERAAKKHFKGNCAVMYHNLMFETLLLNREEISRKGTLSWPVSKDAKCCPLSACDVGCCCMEVICKMMKDSNRMVMYREHKKYRLTGREKLTPGEMMDMMSQAFNMEIQYNEVDRKDWKRMMKDEGMLSHMQICLYEEVFQMMEDGCMKKETDDCTKLLGEKPMDFGEWAQEHRDKFHGY